MIKYRIAHEKDYQNINDFYNLIYSANRSLESFYWEFHNGPFGESIYVIAEDGDKVVGTNCVIPILVTNGEGITYKTGKSEDTLVDPSYRGQKIFFKIYEYLIEVCKEKDIEVIWGFSSANRVFEKIGFSVPFSGQKSLVVKSIPSAYRIMKGTKSWSMKGKIKILGMCLLGKSKLIFRKKAKLKKGLSVVTKPILDNTVQGLVDRNLKIEDSLFGIKQTPAYQSWRLYDNPNYDKVHTYGILDGENNLVALVVLNSNKDKSANICQAIVDYQTLNNHDAVQIFKYVLEDLFKQGIVLIQDFVFSTNSLNEQELHNLGEAGFKHFKKGNGFVWKEIGEFNMKPENFYLSRMATQGVN